MKKFEMKYYNTYYYCNLITNVINSVDYLPKIAQILEDYFDEESANLFPFPKESMLHQFCAWFVDTLIWEEVDDELSTIEEEIVKLGGYSENNLKEIFTNENVFIEDDNYLYLELEYVIKEYTGEKLKFLDWLLENDFEFLQDAARDYFEEHYELIDKAIACISNEMFYLLFQNREFLMWFNSTIASFNDYQMKRVNIPKWVKRAVFFRDKGKCVLCNKDLSGKYDVVDEFDEQYDHIVSLAEHGINDISNIQLICKKCNLIKSKNSMTKNVCNYWYDKDDMNMF